MKIDLLELVDKAIIRKVEGKLFDRGIRPPWMPKHPLRNSLSLVAACYNVEKYVDKFLSSIVSQTSGLDRVEVILVDDGSEDSTGEIAQRWAARFPDLIRYHRQSNKGVCEARNTGLRLATGSWVSFPDPDDFLHHHYLRHVDRMISVGQKNNLSLVCCNFIRFFERTGRKRDDHALNFRFKGGATWLPAKDLGRHLQLAANSAFMRRDHLITLGLSFDARVKPTFEDAHLISRYLLNLPHTSVVFTPEARYYYRKRADETSLMDTSKLKKELYLAKPRYGWLSVLNEARHQDGRIPAFIQRTILYDIIGHFNTYLKRPQSSNILSQDEKHEYEKTMSEVVRSLDPHLVNNTNLPGLSENIRVGVLNAYFGMERPITNVNVTHYDQYKKLARISFCSTSSDHKVIVKLNGRTTTQLFAKVAQNKFLNQDFYYEHSSWFPLESGLLTVEGVEFDARFRIKGKTVGSGILGDRIVELFAVEKAREPWLVGRRSSAFEKIWLLMDRANKADDNAEHFYRYLRRNQPQVNAAFVLEKNSDDWARLQAEGFRLIAFGSKIHRRALQQAEFLISSHADQYIRVPFPGLASACRFIFIQHGVTIHNQSEWFNHIMPSLLATATEPEFRSITDHRSDYYLSKKEVFLTGFPRHDRLLSRETSKRILLIMPTWREHLSGNVLRAGVRALKPGFAGSEYVKEWGRFVRSERLKGICDSSGVEIVFCPHPNFSDHLQEFQIPDYVRVVRTDKIPSLQPYFCEMAAMVTDYSSVAFDAAFLDKPVIYFQFDRDAFFRGHIIRSGYFNYDCDGFGPVTLEHDATISSVEKALIGEEDIAFHDRRIQAFAHRDGRSSERLFAAINSLNDPIGSCDLE